MPSSKTFLFQHATSMWEPHKWRFYFKHQPNWLQPLETKTIQCCTKCFKFRLSLFIRVCGRERLLVMLLADWLFAVPIHRPWIAYEAKVKSMLENPEHQEKLLRSTPTWLQLFPWPSLLLELQAAVVLDRSAFSDPAPCKSAHSSVRNPHTRNCFHLAILVGFPPVVRIPLPSRSHHM